MRHAGAFQFPLAAQSFRRTPARGSNINNPGILLKLMRKEDVRRSRPLAKMPTSYGREPIAAAILACRVYLF